MDVKADRQSELRSSFYIKIIIATLLYHRNGDFVKYSGDLLDEFDILEWITDRNTLEIPGKIEEVNEDMLDALLEEESDLVVFMYRDGNRFDNL